VPGNHDKVTRKLTEEFSWFGNLAEVSVHGQPIVLGTMRCVFGIVPTTVCGTCTGILTGTYLI
jgi:hypothetical protein